MAARQRQLAKKIVIWARSTSTRQHCLQQTWCDQAPDTPAEAVRQAQLVVVCAPVNIIPDLVTTTAAHLSAHTLVTDVGSTKKHICQHCQATLPPGTHFVGSHPMAGSEKNGQEHATATLFTKRPCLITPLPQTDPAALQTIRRFWEQLDMRVHTLDPASHDTIIAHISHLPHLLAFSLCHHLADQAPQWNDYVGQGLRDTTRIAASNPKLWQSILHANHPAILKTIDAFDQTWQHLRTLLNDPTSPALHEFLQRAQAYRNNLE